MHLLALALAPALVLMLYIYRKDRLEPEPRAKVLKVMIWGALFALPAIIMEDTLGNQEAQGLAFYVFVVVAGSEELCKFAAVLWAIYSDPEFDEPMDGIVYCVAASLGFAALENIFYVLSGGVGVGVLRALLSVPGHALFGVGMGYFVGMSRFSGCLGRMGGVALGLAVAVMMHGVYDYCCFASDVWWNLGVFPLMAVYWWWGLKLIRRAQGSTVAYRAGHPDEHPDVQA